MFDLMSFGFVLKVYKRILKVAFEMLLQVFTT